MNNPFFASILFPIAQHTFPFFVFSPFYPPRTTHCVALMISCAAVVCSPRASLRDCGKLGVWVTTSGHAVFSEVISPVSY